MRLRDKAAIVTGSTSGIGKAAAERFAAEGAMVTVVGRNAEHGQAIERELKELTASEGAGDALFVQADVSRPDDVRKVVDATVGRWGRVDILVNNAAVMTFTPIAELDEADWDKVLGVNLKAAFLFAKHCLPHMRAGGAIVNVSSVHAQSTSPTVVPYAASKGGLEAFTRGLAVECAEQKIRVNALRPGAVDTPMLWGNPNVKSGAETIDPSDVGKPEEIAAAILFLASDEAAFITGAVLNVDGGRLAKL